MTISTPHNDPSGATMKAITWSGSRDVRITNDFPKPFVTESKDVVVRVTATSISGSDLHIYHSKVPGLRSGQVLGGEAVGIVESVGPEVTNVKTGDRVVVSAMIACGTCRDCQKGKPALCPHSYPIRDKDMENEREKTKEAKSEVYAGAKTAGLLGYPTRLGGLQGTQAQYLRVPFADYNCLVLPASLAILSEEAALLLSDALPTAMHAHVLGKTKPEDKLVVWGAGPIGVLVCTLALLKYKVRHIILIDGSEERLAFAYKHLTLASNHGSPASVVQTLDYNVSTNVISDVREMLGGELASLCIDCVGFRYSKSWTHSIEVALSFETDSLDSLKEAILLADKHAHVVVIGEYLGEANHFPIGSFFEKSLILKGGRSHNQVYWKQLLHELLDPTSDLRKYNPEFLVTHRIALENAPQAYKLFDDKEAGVMKILIKPEVSSL